jgi:probable rRNA maturation factor
MVDPPSPTGVAIVVSDEQDEVTVDASRWASLAHDVLVAEHRRGELTLTFVDRDEMASLNAEHMHEKGATDVLSFPLDAADDTEEAGPGPVLLGDVVVCPAVAAANAPTHAGTIDDELALLVVHGVLHVLGHDHAEPGDTATMRSREIEHLINHHWRGSVPSTFRGHQQT